MNELKIKWHKKDDDPKEAVIEATTGILFVGGCADNKVYPIRSPYIEVGCDVPNISYTLRYRYVLVKVQKDNGDFGFICIPHCDQKERIQKAKEAEVIDVSD